MSSLKDIKAKTYEEVLLTQYTNCIAFLVGCKLSDKEKEQIEKYKQEFKTEILNLMEGKRS